MVYRPRIGISACFFHADPNRPIFKGKTLLYAEQSMLRYVMRAGGLPWLIPDPFLEVSAIDLVDQIDGLVLQGGSDLSPTSYGQTAEKPEWEGDAIRDRYEIELVKVCRTQSKPILGICRGAQLLNVALGGTLHQDIDASPELDNPTTHRNWEIYDQLAHDVRLEPGSYLAQLYGRTQGTVNSVHHQAIRDLASALRIEARSEKDNVVEAVRDPEADFCLGVQWHPEFMDPGPSSFLDPLPLIEGFIDAVEKRKGGAGGG